MTTKTSTLVVSAGMPRSASTWVYNALRLILQARIASENLTVGWINDIRALPETEYILCKMHDYEETWVSRSSIVVYSYRDVRDAIASHERIFNSSPNLAQVDKYLANDELWRTHADLLIRYEALNPTMRDDLLTTMATLLHMDTPLTRIRNVLNQLTHSTPKTGTTYDTETLLYPNHITDGRPASWQGQLDLSLVNEIESKHHEWFKNNGYEIDTPGR